MLVVATKLGYLDKLREVGEEFDAPDGVTGSWFKPVHAQHTKQPPSQQLGGKRSGAKVGDEQAAGDA